MGYTTTFSGMLEFTKPLTKEEKEKLQTFMGADCREHPEWGIEHEYLTWIDLEIDENDEGLIWDGSEKTYDLPEKINMILRIMRTQFPTFNLKGTMYAQGEEWNDRWALTIENGWAVVKETFLSTENQCPNCGHIY